MKELTKQLESLVNKLEDDLVILKRSGGNFMKVSVFKKVEDGIFDNIHNANEHQLHVITSGGYKFQFYTEFNSDKVALKNEITKRIRENKLNILL